jgi:uncharacterized protein YjhX (UPF0386 family)
MITASVGLPLFKAKHIVWLALESLSRQKHVNYEWELIVAEEQHNGTYGRVKLLKEYTKKLAKVGCHNIKYISLDSWIPLSQKWRLIAKECDRDSQFFVIQAADGYSQPYRMKETFELIQSCDIVSIQVCPMYDIISDQLALYDRRSNPSTRGQNMSIKTEFIRNLSLSKKRRSVDGWLVNQANINCMKKYKRNLIIKTNTSDSWKLGLETAGLNVITAARSGMIQNPTKDCPFTKDHNLTLETILPDDIITRLKECKQFLNTVFV